MTCAYFCKVIRESLCRIWRCTTDGAAPLSISSLAVACRLCLRKHSRHTMAMDLLQEGVDRSVIALRLGHEAIETTQIYLEATLAIKEKALAKTTRSEEHTSELQSQSNIVCRLLLEKKNNM